MRPRVYATTHPSDPALRRVMFRDAGGIQACLVDNLPDEAEAARLAKAIGRSRPASLIEAREVTAAEQG